MDNLVPILTEALIDVCKETPEDPIDHLAEYLFKRSLDVPYPDPSTFWETHKSKDKTNLTYVCIRKNLEKLKQLIN